MSNDVLLIFTLRLIEVAASVIQCLAMVILAFEIYPRANSVRGFRPKKGKKRNGQ